MNEFIPSPQILLRINLAQRMLMKWIDRDMQERIGVTATQVAALFYLLENDGCLLVDLSRELMQNKSAITTLVERMEKNGLLEKVPSPTDKRASQLFLSAKGRQLGLKALPYVSAYDEVLAQGFRQEELASVIRFLDAVIAKFEVLPENYFKRKNFPGGGESDPTKSGDIICR